MKKKVDIIVSCYNEELNILPFFDEAKNYCDNEKYNFNIVFVDDGSVDKTLERILELKCNNEIDKKYNDKISISYISFDKNYGHEAAMCAGLDFSNADYIIFMDVDLQNPPSKIPEILEKFESGADCVLLRRVKYKNVPLLKKITSVSYYWFSKYILRNKNARDVSDFFAIDKNLAEKIKKDYDTTLRFIRSFVQNEAKSIQFVNYENGVRVGGVSRYTYLKLLKLAIVSEVSRIKYFRDKYKVTKENPVYVISKKEYII